MKAFKVSQKVNDDYDTYDSFVVICESEKEARYTLAKEGLKDLITEE